VREPGDRGGRRGSAIHSACKSDRSSGGDLELAFGDGFEPADVDRFLEILADGGIRVENIDARHGGRQA